MEFSELTERLCAWYEANRRDLPWREDREPYHILLSELMLQQTRVSAVIPYYRRFLAALPTLEALAAAEEETLLGLWQGLGYYNRVRNLQKAAQTIVSVYGGAFPRTEKEMKSLPGIGDYTAGAVLSIAFNEKTPAVDGNVLRIYARICGLSDNVSDEKTKRKVREAVRLAMPDNAGDYTQALMELGATVCLPNGKPLCETCPVKNACTAYREGTADRLPVVNAEKPRRIEERTVYFEIENGTVLLRRRPPTGLLASFWEFPNDLSAPAGKVLCRCSHAFSHIEWRMTGVLASAPQTDAETVRARLDEIGTVYPLPSAFRGFLKPLKERMKP